jgi:AmmeMemoRadiSam system protein A
MINPDVLFDIAWESIRKIVHNNEEWLPDLDQDWLKTKQGVFVTGYILKDGQKELRGCIGLPYPEEPLGNAIAISARRTVSEDPRFPPVSEQELDNLIISLEILSEVEEIEYQTLDELKNKINLGRDGLIVRYRGFAGLLLPRVPVEYGWTKDEYLQAIARKAYLSFDNLSKPECHMYKFTSQYFEQ